MRLRPFNNEVGLGMEISQDQLLGEEDYANVQRQSLYDDQTLTLCHSEYWGQNWINRKEN